MRRKTIVALAFLALSLFYSVAAYTAPAPESVDMTLLGSYASPSATVVSLSLTSSGEESAAASELSARSAIEQGISNALSKAADDTDRRIYIRRAGGLQETGVFDKYVASGSQRWVFNYVTAGESFTNMTNLTPVVYVWEKTNLTFSEIASQVQSFINST